MSQVITKANKNKGGLIGLLMTDTMINKPLVLVPK